jgi:hypothetical protein
MGVPATKREWIKRMAANCAAATTNGGVRYRVNVHVVTLTAMLAVLSEDTADRKRAANEVLQRRVRRSVRLISGTDPRPFSLLRCVRNAFVHARVDFDGRGNGASITGLALSDRKTATSPKHWSGYLRVSDLAPLIRELAELT